MTENPQKPLSSGVVLHTYTETAYLQYAIATVKDRALAQVEDGLKPVQRRILYAMRQLGLKPDVKPVKSARIVGEVLGKYHPHGDSAAYEAMVRMAQPFTLRYPLVTGQGNFGSRDGDSAAAMRYTEAKLSPIADLLLSETDKGTIDFADNYDGTTREPTLLSARLPMLLLNGTMGIAVGMAADIPPHNLAEVGEAAAFVLESVAPVSIEDVLRILPGPDFPDGGQLISTPTQIREVYASGRGSLRCRARWTREDLARGQWRIVIRELPYQVSARKILEQIDALINPAPATGKKVLNQQQILLKQTAIDLLEKVSDESDKDNPVRLVIYPKTAKTCVDRLMSFLMTNTALEEAISVNMTAVGLDGRPCQKNLVELLSEWGAFRVVSVRRRLEHELSEVQKRIHVLEGRYQTFINLDRVIAVIREAEDPRSELISIFGFSDVQATDILEMRLRQLNRLEGFAIEAELAQLRKDEARILKILSSEKILKTLVVKEIRSDAALYGDARRTVLEPAESAVLPVDLASPGADELFTIAVSRNLWAKAYKGGELGNTDISYRAGDASWLIIQAKGKEDIFVLDSTGRLYSIAVRDVPIGKGEGVPLTALLSLQEGAQICHVFTAREGDDVLFVGESGYGFIAKGNSLKSKLKAGKQLITLSQGEKPLAPIIVSCEEYRAKFVAIGYSDGRLQLFPVEEVKRLDKGKGVQLASLGTATISTLKSVSGFPLSLTVSKGKSTEQIEISEKEAEKYLGHRARKGALLPKKAIAMG